jgi:hypothetical protein
MRIKLAAPQVSPSTIECVLLTNGHLDQWLVTLLVNQGFSGKFIVVI